MCELDMPPVDGANRPGHGHSGDPELIGKHLHGLACRYPAPGFADDGIRQLRGEGSVPPLISHVLRLGSPAEIAHAVVEFAARPMPRFLRGRARPDERFEYQPVDADLDLPATPAELDSQVALVAGSGQDETTGNQPETARPGFHPAIKPPDSSEIADLVQPLVAHYGQPSLAIVHVSRRLRRCGHAPGSFARSPGPCGPRVRAMALRALVRLRPDAPSPVPAGTRAVQRAAGVAAGRHRFAGPP